MFNCAWVACRIFVPWPGIRPRPPALGEWNLNHWSTREVPVQEALILSKPGVQSCCFDFHGGLSKFPPRLFPLELRVEFDAIFPQPWRHWEQRQTSILLQVRPKTCISHPQHKVKPLWLFLFFLPLLLSWLPSFSLIALPFPSFPFSFFSLLAYFSKEGGWEKGHEMGVLCP